MKTEVTEAGVNLNLGSRDWMKRDLSACFLGIAIEPFPS
jgi:hypothetical protein